MEMDLSKQAEEIGARIAADKFEHCTRDPIFLVEQKIRDYGFDPSYCDECVWVDSEGEVDEETANELTRKKDEFEDIPGDFTYTGFRDRWEFVTACFTYKGAEDFITRQKHNLKETRIYADSLYRNQEMIEVREFLKQHANKTTIA